MQLDPERMKLMKELRVKKEKFAELQKEIAEMELEMLQPVLYNLEDMDEVYRIFEDLIPNIPDMVGDKKNERRKKFLMIAFLLYYPRVLTREKVRPGLRRKIAEVLGCSPCFISDNIEIVAKYYDQYSIFKNVTHYLYDIITNELIASEIIR